jgi:DNA-binding PadR family transcriptional regulator
LLLLAEGEAHGYELINLLEQLDIESDCLDSSIIYRDLRDMEEMGLIHSMWDDDSKGPRRRVYKIDQEGWSKLEHWLDGLGRVRDQIGTLQNRYQQLGKIKEK